LHKWCKEAKTITKMKYKWHKLERSMIGTVNRTTKQHLHPIRLQSIKIRYVGDTYTLLKGEEGSNLKK